MYNFGFLDLKRFKEYIVKGLFFNEQSKWKKKE